MAQVELKNVIKRFGSTQVVHGADLFIEDDEFIVLVGPSGCGKSTILRMIAGLESVSGGEICINGRPVNEVAPKDRNVAMVFQNYALYPHMSVHDNMAFSLKMAKESKADIAAKVKQAAEILELTPYLHRKPSELSGGQRQRVAMGRAIVRNPQVFLFDEPLSNLDAKLRVQMRTEIKKVHQKVRTTTVYVTHDQVEAMTLADRVVVMNAGVIEQVGPPEELYHHPSTRFVAGFIGSPGMNFLTCKLAQNGAGLSLQLNDEVALPVPADRAERYRGRLGQEMVLGIRPEHLTEVRPQPEPGCAELPVAVEVVEPMGMETVVFFGLNGGDFCARVNPSAAAAPGQPLTLMANMNHMHLIDPETQMVI